MGQITPGSPEIYHGATNEGTSGAHVHHSDPPDQFADLSLDSNDTIVEVDVGMDDARSPQRGPIEYEITPLKQRTYRTVQENSRRML